MALAVSGDSLIDGTGADPVRDSCVRIDGDRIVEIGPPRRGDELWHVAGGTVLPGLVDAHVHLGLASNIEDTFTDKLSVAERAADIFANCSRILDQGFTTVRDVGGIDWGVVGALNEGRIRGPRASTAGPILCQTGGHAHYAPPGTSVDNWVDKEIPGLATLSFVCDGPQQVRRAAREAFRRGAAFLKMNVTGGVISVSDRLEDTQFTVDEIRAAVEEAEARGTYVTAHAHNNVGIRNAIEAGVRCVEHGTSIDGELAEEMAARGVAMVPTLSVVHLLATNYARMGVTERISERAEGAEKRMREATRLAHSAGVTVGSGTDFIGPHDNAHGLELKLKAEEIGPMAAIVSTTSVNAGLAGCADRVGTLQQGKLADVLVVDFDPLTEPERWDDPDRVKLVVQNGRVVRNTLSNTNQDA